MSNKKLDNGIFLRTVTTTKNQTFLTIPRELVLEMNFNKSEPVRIWVDKKTKNLVIERIGGLVE
jgi:hypothetical protein